jgi:large subunit ribosomal protein L9
MKVLLQQDVKKIGRKGDIVEVSDGFAVNALFPTKKAVQATAQIINEHKTKQRASKDKQEKEKQQTIANLNQLEGKSVTISEKLNAKGTLYHALGSKEIIKAVYNQHNVKINNTVFGEKYNLKEAGEYDINLTAFGVSVTLQLIITGA